MVKKIAKIEPVSQKYTQETVPVLRVRAYCRVSTGVAEQKDSFEAQVQCYSRMIQDKDGWVYAGTYADEVRSGIKLTGRDEFYCVLQDCRLGKIDLIFTKSVIRLVRNIVDSIKAIRQLKELGVDVYFEKERVNTLSKKSEQLLTILSSIVQGGSESISTNNRWVIVRRSQNGTYTISSSAYGYVSDENGELVIKQEEAAAVRRISDSYLGGKGFYTIARELRQEGLSTVRYLKGWQDSVVKGILQNPVYEGDLPQQKTYTTEGAPFIKGRNYGQPSQYLTKDNHKVIITREEVEAVRQLCEYRRQRQCAEDRTTYQNRYVFSSRVICGECGSALRRQRIYIGKPYEKIRRSCHQHIGDISKCRQKAVREDGIRQAFVQLWNRPASNYEAILFPLLSVLKVAPGDPAQEKELEDLKKKIQELKKQSHMLRKVLADDNIGSAIFIEQRSQMDMKPEKACHRQQLSEEQKVFEQEIAQTGYLLTVFRNRPVVIEEFDEELFLIIIQQVTVYPVQHLGLRLENGLELEETCGKAMEQNVESYANGLSDCKWESRDYSKSRRGCERNF